MGMFNWVVCECPRCGGEGYMQIMEVVTTPVFGQFDVDDLSTLSDLSPSELTQVKAEVLDNMFECGGRAKADGCGHSFNPYQKASVQGLFGKGGVTINLSEDEFELLLQELRGGQRNHHDLSAYEQLLNHIDP